MTEFVQIPKVSILMTVYNRERFLAEAIESVLASDFSDFELIIVDDRSNDNSLDIARGYETRDRRVRVFLNGKNLGDYANRNKAASYARGEYLMNVDSDDKIFIDGIRRCLEAMIAHPEAPFGMNLHTANTLPCFFLDPATSIHEHFFKKSFLTIGPGGTVTKRIFFNEIGGYPEKYGPANDMYFNLKAAAIGGVLMLPFEFLYYRIHEGQEINNHFAYLYQGYRYMRDVLTEVKFPLRNDQVKWIANKNKRRFFTNIVSFFFKTFNFKKTTEAIRKAGYGIKDAKEGIFH